MKKLPLRPNVCMLLFDKKFRLFLGERQGQKGIWQFPQGGVERKYSLKKNVIRELHEETGAPAKHFKVIKRLNARHSYEFSRPPSYAKNKWRGQSQTFWLVKFLGKNRHFNLKRYTPEFSRYKWCTVEEVLKMAEPKRVKGYRKPLREFKRYLLLVRK